jgi:hypothetical protein
MSGNWGALWRNEARRDMVDSFAGKYEGYEMTVLPKDAPPPQVLVYARDALAAGDRRPLLTFRDGDVAVKMPPSSIAAAVFALGS